LSPRSILVTGASGFIGTHVTRGAIEKGWRVTAAVRSAAQAQRLRATFAADGERLKVRDGYDLFDPNSVTALFENGPYDAVVHAAAFAPQARVVALSDLIAGDVAGTIQLAEASTRPHASRFILLSSALVYGSHAGARRECEPIAPRDPYGIAKAMSANACAYLSRQGLAVSELRLFNVYGPGDRPPRLVPYCIENAIAGRPIEVLRDKELRDFVHVSDVVRAIFAAAGGLLPTGPTNVATGNATSIGDVARMVVELTGSSSALVTPAKQTGPHTALHGCTDRLSQYGLKPLTALADGLADTIARKRQKPARENTRV